MGADWSFVTGAELQPTAATRTSKRRAQVDAGIFGIVPRAGDPWLLLVGCSEFGMRTDLMRMRRRSGSAKGAEEGNGSRHGILTEYRPIAIRIGGPCLQSVTACTETIGRSESRLDLAE